MDKYDANTWTKSFVSKNRSECIKLSWETNELVIKYLRQRTKSSISAAIWGLNMLMSGLATMQEGNCGDFRSYLFGYSMVTGAVILLYDIDMPEHKRREVAISAFLDARDFATSEQAKRNMQEIVSELNSKTPLSEVCKDFDEGEIISLLQDLGSRLLAE